MIRKTRRSVIGPMKFRELQKEIQKPSKTSPMIATTVLRQPACLFLAEIAG